MFSKTTQEGDEQQRKQNSPITPAKVDVDDKESSIDSSTGSRSFLEWRKKRSDGDNKRKRLEKDLLTDENRRYVKKLSCKVD